MFPNVGEANPLDNITDGLNLGVSLFQYFEIRVITYTTAVIYLYGDSLYFCSCLLAIS